MERLVRQVRARVEAILDPWGLLEHVDLDDQDGQVELQLGSVQGRGAARCRNSEPQSRERRGLYGWDAYYDLHAGQPIPGADRSAMERLVRYLARPPLSLQRLSQMDDGRLCLRMNRAWSDGTFHFLFRPMELLRRVAAIIVHPRVHMVHYFGVLAPHAKWRAQVVPKQETHTLPDGEPVQKKRSSWIKWADLLLRTFGVLGLRCSRCGGDMRVRAVVRTSSTAANLLPRLTVDTPIGQLTLQAPTRGSPLSA